MGTLDLNSVLASCSYYPVALDLCPRVIWFAGIERETYSQAAFLIPRGAPMSEERYGFNLDDVLLHDLSLPIGGAPSHYIFISAFCCSTLLARLFDEVPECLVLKEPSILGQIAMMRYRPRTDEAGKMAGSSTVPLSEDPAPAMRGVGSPDSAFSDDRVRGHPAAISAKLAHRENREEGVKHWTSACAGATSADAWEDEWRTWAALSIRLLTRTFEPRQTVIVKAADVCNTMGDVILANDPRSKAVLLSVGLRTFILSVLKLGSRRAWTRRRANFWHKTLGLFPALNAVNVPELDDAQKAAYLWLVTAALWDRLRKQTEPERLLLMDGEEVSEDPGAALETAAAFLDLPLNRSQIEAILANPLVIQHAKIPGQAYDAATRRSDRADWEERYGTEADRAMEWAASIRASLESGGIDFRSMARDERKELVS